ncbi:DUF1772-domain-containing protein [Didymella exigua CBS 183.55]|uniref:DUF1772-domain-containing protein n=1 Tax=Didymella exigua CBS 183.55 TaxID=1150837 RepID=A0A6A5RUR2_9PLEO|nr:DUF1772-domain-containing protein [Didymella exigua CBS 183.55]KAF1932181.1 DUF1772-domain-containing protein [Didymella exigua CBS 183.55]
MASAAFTTGKLVGFAGAAWLSGTIASLSLVSVPAVTKSLKEDGLSAAHAVKVWRNNFDFGKGLAPPVALATASSLAFCGWTARNTRATGLKDGRLFFLSAALTIAIVPFTIIFMGSTNAKLLSLAKKEELTASEGQDGEALLNKWASINGVRSLLPLAGAVLTGALILA